MLPGGSEVKASAWNAGDLGSISGSGRSPGEGNGNPLQYPCLKDPWMEKPGRLQSKTNNFYEDVEKFKPLYTVGGNAKWCCCGKQYSGTSKK